MQTEVIILAAGQGTRMRSAKPKVLHELAGKALINHVFESVQDFAMAVHLVVGHGAEQVQEALPQRQANFVFQQTQSGTGHAVATVLPELAEQSKVLILYGDVPLICPKMLKHLCALVNDSKMGLVTVNLDPPKGYGRIVRNEQNQVQSIIEEKDASSEIREINEVNTGIMAVTASNLRKWLPQLSNDNAQKEYYLTDIIAMAVADGVAIETLQPEQSQQVQGINDRLQLAELERWHQLEKAQELMRKGCTLLDPNRLDIRGELTVGQDVEIDVNAVFEGKVNLGDGVKIGPNCVIKNASLGAGTAIAANSVIEGAVIGKNNTIGPFARLRPGAKLADQVHVGNFVEIKNAFIGQGSKAGHLTYVGDAEVGEAVNLGAGTVTCNYDGANKHKTLLEDGAFIGTHTSLVAPVKVGKNAITGAGSTITHDVPDNALGLSRTKQTNLANWKKPVKQAK